MFMKMKHPKQYGLSASLWNSLQRFHTLGLRMAGFLHQFKTPLHVIQSQTELLLEDAALSPKMRSSLELIQQNVNRLADQTQSILDLSRGKSHPAQVAPLGRLMEEICQASQADCRKKNVTIEKHVIETTPIRMDRLSLEGALHNLVNNAIEAMPKGGVLKITTFDQPGSRQTGVRIEDDGPGMARRTLRNILQTPFHTSKSNGTGLGIYITRHILRRHRACMRWESKPGAGTKVTILFPAVKTRQGNRSLWRRLAHAFAILALVVGPIGASGIPQFLRLQGRFTDNPQTPLTDTLPIRFSIWDVEDGYGNLLWQDVQNVAIQSSTFQVVLGRVTPLPPSVFSGGDRWLELQIGNDTPLRPRHKIPNQLIPAQVAAPPPAPVRQVTPPPAPIPAEEKREIDLQFEKYNESVLKEELAPKPPVKPVHHHHPKPPPQVTTSEVDGELQYVYTVQAGDTLKSVAQKLYGKGERWYDLYYLNRDRLGPMGYLFPGQILVLPTPFAGDKSK